MEVVRQFLDPFLQKMGQFFPNIIGALVIVAVGVVIAHWLRKAAVKILAATALDAQMEKKTGRSLGLEKLVANLCYYFVLLWVLLLTLDVLEIKGVLDPVMNLINEIFAAVPNIVAAALIAAAGYLLARIVASGVEVFSQGLDRYSAKMGLGREMNLSRLLGQVVFLVIFIPLLISGLDALKIHAISVPSTAMLTAILAAVPKILAAALIIVIAYLIGRFVSSVLAEILQNVGADQVPEKLGFRKILGESGTFSRLCGAVLFYLIMLSATVSAVEQVEMGELAKVLGGLLVFSGQVILGLVILAIGNFIANVAYRALAEKEDRHWLAVIARAAILGLVFAMGLRAMGLADEIVDLAFGLVLGAIAVAFALAFGLGGREAAGRQVDHWLQKMRKDKEG